MGSRPIVREPNASQMISVGVVNLEGGVATPQLGKPIASQTIPVGMVNQEGGVATHS